MQAGRLRERITFEYDAGTTQDDGGQPVEDWQPLATNPTVWASILPKASGERFLPGGAQVQAEITHAVRVRYRSDVTVKMRLLWGTRTLHIESTVDPDGRGSDMVLMCKEVVP